MELSFRFQFSMKILENAFGCNDGVFIFHFRKIENAFGKIWKTTKISFFYRILENENFHFPRKLLKTELTKRIF